MLEFLLLPARFKGTAVIVSLIEEGSGNLAGARCTDGLAGAVSNSIHPCKLVGLFGIFR